MRRVWTILLFALIPPAFAQDGFNAHGFEMAAQDGDPRDGLTVLRAGRFHQGEFFVSSFVEYADAPLVLVHQYPDGRPDVVEPQLDNLMALNLSAGIAVHDHVRLDVGAPLFVSSTGLGGVSQGFAIGDIRVTPTVALVRPAPRFGGGFGLAVAPWIDLPTGDPDAYLGNQGLTFGGRVAATYEAGPVTISADVGPKLNPTIEALNQTGADQLQAGIGGGVVFARNFGVVVEGRMSRALASNSFKGTDSPAEVLGAFRGRLDNGLHFLAGGATAVSRGAGAASWRGFVGIGFGRVQTSFGDWDQDGVADENDQCLKEDEVLNAFEDADGCPDAGGRLDMTVRLEGFVESGVVIEVTDGVNHWEVESGLDPVGLELPSGTYQVEAGYPGFEAEQRLVVEQGAQQLVLELQPVVPGTLSISLQHAHAGSLDKVGFSVIGEGMPMSEVLGPMGLASMELPPGQYLVYLKSNDGAIYRKYITIVSNENVHLTALLRNPRVKITETKVEVSDKIFFETGSATIAIQSFDLLEEIGTLLIANDQVAKVEIQGHTDAEGGDADNLTLSQDRADAVKTFLVEVGVAPERLEAVGYGETAPIASNDTEEGKAANRRVEFLIK